MKDEVGGFQNFLFKWIGLPREKAMSVQGSASEIYLENLAPLFYIEQKEGWTDLQALQVYRYGIQQIADIAVEYLLGAVEAIHNRFSTQTAAAREAGLKASFEAVGDQIRIAFQRRGWIVDWSSHGSAKDIAARWSKRRLTQVLEEDFEMSVGKEMDRLRERALAIRSLFARENLDTANTSASSDVSQAVVDLKDQRHQLREELRVTRSQVEDLETLAESLDHRIRASRDVLRFKQEGVGRLGYAECPTCHRTLELSTFDLTSQSEISVEVHIEALKRSRQSRYPLRGAVRRTEYQQTIAPAPVTIEVQIPRFACLYTPRVRSQPPHHPNVLFGIVTTHRAKSDTCTRLTTREWPGSLGSAI